MLNYDVYVDNVVNGIYVKYHYYPSFIDNGFCYINSYFGLVLAKLTPLYTDDESNQFHVDVIITLHEYELPENVPVGLINKFTLFL